MHRPRRNWHSTPRGPVSGVGGTGSVRTVDLDTLVPDDTLSIDDGAVAPWNSLMWSSDDGCVPGDGSSDRYSI